MNPWPPDDPASPIVRYLTGELSEREEIELLRTLEQDPEQRQLYAQLRVMWERSGLPKHEWDAHTALERIKRQHTVRAPLRVVSSRRARVRTLLRIAAGLMVMFGSAALWRATVKSPATHEMTQPAVREFSMPRGQRAMFQLSDGTRLVLAAESRLRVPADYGRNIREVHLEGEALFDVVHDAARPFRVLAGGAVAEDLGTRFDVRAYAEDSVVTVAVAEGEVALGRADGLPGKRPLGEVPQGVILRPGELGTMAANGRVTTATGAIVATYLTWAEGRLRFYRTPLADVARTLSRWYDLDVRIENRALASTPITAEFGVQSADELLRELALAVDAEVTRSGKLITLQPKS